MDEEISSGLWDTQQSVEQYSIDSGQLDSPPGSIGSCLQVVCQTSRQLQAMVGPALCCGRRARLHAGLVQSSSASPGGGDMTAQQPHIYMDASGGVPGREAAPGSGPAGKTAVGTQGRGRARVRLPNEQAGLRSTPPPGSETLHATSSTEGLAGSALPLPKKIGGLPVAPEVLKLESRESAPTGGGQVPGGPSMAANGTDGATKGITKVFEFAPPQQAASLLQPVALAALNTIQEQPQKIQPRPQVVTRGRTRSRWVHGADLSHASCHTRRVYAHAHTSHTRALQNNVGCLS